MGFDRLLAKVTNPFLTAGLILAFLVFFLLGAVLPQRPLLGELEYQAAVESIPGWVVSLTESMGLDDVYHSWGMVVLFLLFSLQLCAYILRKAPRIWHEARSDSNSLLAASPPTLRIDDQNLSALASRLKRRRYHVKTLGDTHVVARKNRYSAFAGLLFHASFLLVLIGAWILQSYYFRGDLVLAEGQPFVGRLSEYAKTSPKTPADGILPGLAFTPQSIDPVFSKSGGTIDIRCRIDIPGSPTPKEIRVNQPYRTADADVLLMGFGLAPVVIVRKKGVDRPLDVVCANLGVWGQGHPEDHFDLRKPKARITARFFPDYREGLPVEEQSSAEIRNALFEILIQAEDESIPETRGRLRVGERLAFGDYELEIVELRKWGRFQVSRMEGDLLVLGLLVMAAAAALRLLLPGKWILLREEDDHGTKVITIRAKADLFPKTFERDLPRILDLSSQDRQSSGQ